MKKFYACFLALAIFISATYSQTIRPEFPFTNGYVLTMVKYGNTIYIGGSFTSVLYPSGASYPRNHLAAFNAITGVILPWNPVEGNSVDAVKSMAATNNTIYIGGDITTRPQPMSSRIFAADAVTGTSSNWPAVEFSRSSVSKIIATNTKVYVAATVENSSGLQSIWVYDATNGSLLFTKGTSNSVSSIELQDNILFAGGFFESIESQTRYYIGAIDATSGNVFPWNPAADWGVLSLKIKDKTLYAGGQFTGFGYHPANGITTRPPVPGSAITPIKKIAALDMNTGAVSPWDPKVEGNYVNAIDVNSTGVYIGGVFNSVGGQSRNNIAMVDAVTGAVSSWNPNANNGVTAILADGNTVFVAGPFTSIAGQSRSYFAALTTPFTIPVISCPSSITVPAAPNTCGQLVSFAAMATGSPSPTIVYQIGNTTITSPYNFSVGTTTVRATAISSTGASSCNFNVTVNDTQAPAINNLSTSVNQLWPANHKMKDVSVDYTTSDNCPGAVTTQLSISSNEEVTSQDWKIIDNHHVQLKAERSGNSNGRVYTITVTATDQYGNTSSKNVTVSVPHDQSKSINVRSEETSFAINNELLVRAQANPSHNYFTLLVQSDDGKEKINLRLFDVTGHLLETKNNVSAGETVQMGKKLNPGFYILEYSQGNTVKQTRLIKQ